MSSATIFFADAGQAGFDATHGSIRILLPRGDVNRNVECPSHVKERARLRVMRVESSKSNANHEGTKARRRKNGCLWLSVARNLLFGSNVFEIDRLLVDASARRGDVVG